MKIWLALLPLLLLLLPACGPAAMECRCDVDTSAGPREIACGGTMCAAGQGFRCGVSGIVMRDDSLCSAQQGPTTCTPRTCSAGACGAMADGCGGTLQCGNCSAGLVCSATNTCESRCANVTCGAGQHCEPTTGQCQASPCAQAQAVCGVVGGQTCGTCPGASVCAATKRACIETVATVPAQYVFSAQVSGDQLYLTSTTSLNQSARDLLAVDLTTKQTRTVASQTVLSPLAVGGGSVFWAERTGLRRLTSPTGTPTTISGLDYGCSDLLVSGQALYCGIGGDARYGVSSFGIKKLPLAGGTATWTKTYLNYPHLAAIGQYVFYVGTTDNQYSFKTMGAWDTSMNDDMPLVSGGSLDSSFVMADADSFYFVEYPGTEAVLHRVLFDTNADVQVASGTGFLKDTTVLQSGALVTIAKLGAEEGLWQVGLTAPSTRTLVLSAADLKKTATTGPSHVRATSDGLVFITGNTVYRTVAPMQ